MAKKKPFSIKVWTICRSGFSAWNVPATMRRGNDNIDSDGNFLPRNTALERHDIYCIDFRIFSCDNTVDEIFDNLEHRGQFTIESVETEDGYIEVSVLSWEDDWRKTVDEIRSIIERLAFLKSQSSQEEEAKQSVKTEPEIAAKPTSESAPKLSTEPT